MRMYLTFTKKGLVAVLAALLLGLFISGQLYAADNVKENGKTNKQRVDYIKSIGLEPKEECKSSKEIVIPEKFDAVYQNYNALQQSAGFDLLPYMGSSATVYTYGVNTPEGYTGDTVVNLIVYKGRIIGGDISSCALDGFMLNLGEINVKNKTR